MGLCLVGLPWETTPSHSRPFLLAPGAPRGREAEPQAFELLPPPLPARPGLPAAAEAPPEGSLFPS